MPKWHYSVPPEAPPLLHLTQRWQQAPLQEEHLRIRLEEANVALPCRHPPFVLCASWVKSWILTASKTHILSQCQMSVSPTGTIRSGLFMLVPYIRYKNQTLAHAHCHGAIAIKLILKSKVWPGRKYHSITFSLRSENITFSLRSENRSLTHRLRTSQHSGTFNPQTAFARCHLLHLQLQGLSQSLTPPQQGQCLNTCCRQGQRGKRDFLFNTWGRSHLFWSFKLKFNMLAWAHSLTVTVSWGSMYRNGDFYQRHLQKLQNSKFGEVDFSFSEGSGKCVFVRSLRWPKLETWQCLCSLTGDAGRWAGHIKTWPGKAMAVRVVPCTKAEPSSSTWSHTGGWKCVAVCPLLSARFSSTEHRARSLVMPVEIDSVLGEGSDSSVWAVS